MATARWQSRYYLHHITLFLFIGEIRTFHGKKVKKAKIDPVIGRKIVFESTLLLRNTAGLSSQLSVFSMNNKSVQVT